LDDFLSILREKYSVTYMPSKFCCDELREVLRQGYLNLIPFDSYGTAGDGDVRILRSFAGLYVEPPSVPWTFDDVAIQMAFSERSSRMWTGVVDGVEGSFDIKEGNPDPVNFNCPPSSRGDFLCRGNGDKFRHGDDPSSWPSGQWNSYIPQTRQ
jgi:hypothetical protein